MRSKLSDICHYVKGKVDVAELDNIGNLLVRMVVVWENGEKFG